LSRIMGDSTVLSDIPLDVDIALSYVNGHEGVSSQRQLERRFPHHLYGHCWVDVDGSRPDANVRDWETGDKAGNLEKWVLDHNAHYGKKDAVVYANRSTVPEVRELTGKQRLGIEYFLFVACLDGKMVEGPGIIACQRDGTEQTGGPWDRTFVSDPDWCTPIPLVGKPNCVSIEKALRAPQNNQWDRVVDKHGQAVIHASGRPRMFPFGVKFTQEVVGTPQDGKWGPNSQNALFTTVLDLQNALLLMGYAPGNLDGIWGPNTKKAYNDARLACHV
jgi:hypothetical protein